MGSVQPDLVRGVSESLAGRAGWVRAEELRALPAMLLIPGAWEVEAPQVRRRAEQLARDGIC